VYRQSTYRPPLRVGFQLSISTEGLGAFDDWEAFTSGVRISRVGDQVGAGLVDEAVSTPEPEDPWIDDLGPE
jgi:hypothetical protein